VKPRVTAFFLNIYHHLLQLYPVEFFAEFGAEMEAVFSEALTEAQQKGIGPVLVLFLRELRELPRSLWREQRRSHQYQSRIIAMANDSDEPGYWQPATGLETAVTLLPFVLFSILYTLEALAYARGTPELPYSWQSFYRHLSVYLVALTGLGIGWVRRFPRWSLGYVGLVLIYTWWLHGLVLRGFTLFGHPVNRWDWLVWTALLAVALVATLITRSLSPLVDLAKSIWHDWSRLSFILYGALSWLALGIILDTGPWTDPVAILPQVFCAALFFVLGVLPFLHLTFAWQRGLALQGAFNLAFLSYVAIAVIVSGRADVDWPILAYWFLFLLLPGLLGLMRRSYGITGLTQ
jgi:hypothetical protein